MEDQSRHATLSPPDVVLGEQVVDRAAILFNEPTNATAPSATTIFLDQRRTMKTIFGHFYRGYQSNSTEPPPLEQRVDKNKRAVKCVYVHRYNRRHDDDALVEDPDNEIRIKAHVESLSSHRAALDNHVIIPEYVLSNRTQTDLVRMRQKYYFIVSPLANGGDIFESLDRFGRNEPLCKRTFRQIVHGVQYLHRLRVFHRDLKPENFVMDNDNVYIIDFGQAEIIGDDVGDVIAKNGNGYGTTLYTAPEFSLSNHETHFNWKKADVWALGMTLYIMLINELPEFMTFSSIDQSVQLINCNNINFQAICRHEGLAQSLNGQFSGAVTDLLQRMLLENVQDRISIDEILAHPWMQ